MPYYLILYNGCLNVFSISIQMDSVANHSDNYIDLFSRLYSAKYIILS
jgi:hypothetical protein